MDWMEFTCTQSMHTLDDEQIGALASVAMEDFGPGLTRNSALVKVPTSHQGQPASLTPSRRWQSNMDCRVMV
jgi:hypothetical protein